MFANPFEKPDLRSARRILAIQPHYDDNDIGAGGTLAALAEGGAELFYLTVSDDLVGVIDQSLSEAEMTARLRAEQQQAGAIIGVKAHFWLGYPDAGEYSYFEVRRKIIAQIRRLRPDFLFTVDPWLPYEAHNDHILTGRAAAEAAILFGMGRLAADPESDAAFAADPFELSGVAFYATANPNTVFDITARRAKKHAAIAQYRAQFGEAEMQMLHLLLDFKEQEWAQAEAFSHGEPLKVLRPFHLHGYPDALRT
jgi:LmbE family N-acetylglucosaminyl deacetylase